jgi:hypothetical protein
MGFLFKLFKNLIGFFLPQLDLGGLFIKFIFSLFVVGIAAAGAAVIKHKYDNYKTTQENNKKLKENITQVVDTNKDLEKTIDNTKKSGEVTADSISKNSDAKADIESKTNHTLSNLDKKRKEAEIKKKEPVKPKTDIDKPSPSKDYQDKTISEHNIDAAWKSFCEMGGNSELCSANT